MSLLEPLSPYFWGVKKLDIDKAALENRTFTILSGEFLFPDGSYVAIPENGLLQPRAIDEILNKDGFPLQVYIGIKKYDPSTSNVTIVENKSDSYEVSSRFVAFVEPESVKDMHSQGPPAEVKTLYYNVKLFFENEKNQLGDFVHIPLAQLVLEGDELKLSKKFVPPCLTINADKRLLALIKEIKDLISAKGHQLEEYKRQRGVHSAEFGSRDMVYLLALRSLNRYIPILLHLLETQEVHPWHVYGLLRQLVGELSVFSEGYNVTGKGGNDDVGLSVYNHLNIYKCIANAHEIIINLINEITAGPEYVISLDFDGTYYAADLKPGMFQAGNRYYLAINSTESPDQLVESLQASAKLSAREYLPILIARALPGIKLESLSVPPQELPRRANTYYFQIDHHSEQWESVQKGNNIALYWDTAPEDVAVELMVVEAR